MREHPGRLIAFHEAQADYARAIEDPISEAIQRERQAWKDTPIREPGEWSDEQIGAAVRLAREGAGAEDIAKELGIPRREILSRLGGIRRCLERWQKQRARGMSHHPERENAGRASSVTEKQIEEAVALRIAGFGSWDRIAEAVGSTSGALRYVMTRTARGRSAIRWAEREARRR